MSIEILTWAISYLAGINLLSFAVMVFDKAQAASGSQRVSERMLLNLALIGGSVGTVVAQQTIRHKTRKEPFRSRLIAILMFQIVVMIALVAGLFMTGSPDALWQSFVSALAQIR